MLLWPLARCSQTMMAATRSRNDKVAARVDVLALCTEEELAVAVVGGLHHVPDRGGLSGRADRIL